MTAAATHFGLQTASGERHATNEDALGSDPERGVWLVADGMGGHAAGDVAGTLVRDVVLGEIAKGAGLVAAIASAHQAVVEAAAADERRQGMGSTVVAVQMAGEQAHIAWVGDSRAYLLREGSLECLTRDHSLVQWMLDNGQISPQEAAVHPDRHVLVRTLGFEQPTADLKSLSLQSDDLLVLCSDGVTGVLSESDMRRILLEKAVPQAAADTLIDAVVHRKGRDDASVVVIRHGARAKLRPLAWLPVIGGIGLGVLVYLIWNWMNAS